MKTIDMCPICANPAMVPNAKVAFSAPFLNTEAGHDSAPGQTVQFLSSALVQYSVCLRCGVYVQTPRMENDDIDRYYSSGLYRSWLNMTQEDMDRDEQNRATFVAKLIRERVSDNVMSHLDVGSSRGFLLREVDAVFKAGVEPNTQYAAYHPNVEYPILFDVPDSMKFDLVTSLHTLEHVLYPLDVLGMMLMHTTENGKVVIEVPSESSPGGWARLAHTYHYPPWTIHYMARALGWRVSMMAMTPHTLAVLER